MPTILDKIIQKWILMKPIFFLCALVIVPLDLHSASKDESRSEKIQQFKTNQECMQTATAAEDWAKLVPCSKRALELIEDLFDSNHPNVATMAHEHGLALDKHGGYRAESEQILKSAVKKYEKIYGKNSPELVNVLFDYAEILSKRGIFKEHGLTVKTYLRALDLLKAQDNFDILEYADRSADVFETLSPIVSTRFTFDKTKNLGLNTLKIYQQQVGETHYKTARIALNIGKLFLKSETHSENHKAIEYFELSLMNEKVAPYGLGFLIAEAYDRTDQSELSIPYLQKLAKFRQAHSYQTATPEPVYVPPPQYPRLAEMQGVEGYAVVKFTIDRNGQVQNLELIDEKPVSLGFGRASLQAAEKLKYLPKISEEKFVERLGVTYKYSFKISK